MRLAVEQLPQLLGKKVKVKAVLYRRRRRFIPKE
jgi:hypothetical protein